MLISLDDLQSTLNVDLTSPNGQVTATTLIAAATAWISTVVGYPIEETEVTTYLDSGYFYFWLPTGAPVSALTLSTYNSLTNVYDTLDGAYVRYSPTGEVSTTASLPYGFQAVKATYTTGWTAETLPNVLKQALIEMVGVKLMEVSNYSSATTSTDNDGNVTTTTPIGALKKVQSDSYSEEYSTAQSDALWKAKTAGLSRTIGDALPASVMEVVTRYQRPFAI